MTKDHATHERLSRDETIKGSSDRGFGFVFVAVFLVVGLAPVVDGGTVRLWSLAVAALLLAVASIAPKVLAPLNRSWTKFGLLLHHVTNPLIMGFVFYVAVTPTAVVMRLMGKDPLRRRFDPAASTYWIERTPPGPQPETMRNQF